MTPENPKPLWLEAIPDREPWRRGRVVICCISIIILLGQAALIGWSILLGNLTIFLLSVGLGVLALLLLYFIWIGHNWPRWLVAPLYACSGFANAIWGMVYGNGPLFLIGLAGLTMFTYPALAPSVYAFARHQRECIGFAESMIVGAIFLLVVVSVGSGLYSFYVYDTDLQQQATNFAGTAFNKIFVYHDEEFLLANLKDTERALSPHLFIEQVSESLGQPQWVGSLRGVFTTRLAHQHLEMTGLFQMPALYEGSAPVWINLEVSRIGNGWQINHIGWEYRPGEFK